MDQRKDMLQLQQVKITPIMQAGHRFNKRAKIEMFGF